MEWFDVVVTLRALALASAGGGLIVAAALRIVRAR